MKEQVIAFKNRMLDTWASLSKRNKLLIAGAFLISMVAIGLLINWASKPEFTTIYTNISAAEAGEIVNAIESLGVPVQLSPNGTTISVPKQEAARIKVNLANQGIPKSGNIKVLNENVNFGMTDKQFGIVERDAMQNELRYLIEQIDGVQQAEVMITLPEESIWLVDNEQNSSAAVLIHTRQGLELSQPQINGLYHLISRSVPKLPLENITIMNQNMQVLDRVDAEDVQQTLSLFQQQRQIKQDIQKDVQRQLQQMLGTIFGMNNVIVSVFANVDFSQERREEHLVQPVVGNDGIAVSIERIQKSFEGQGDGTDAIAGTGETDIAGYPATSGSQSSEYEELEERINNDVNRIFKQIESTPYLITDMSISVGINYPQDPEGAKQIAEDILWKVVGSSINNGHQLDEQELRKKINVSSTQFVGGPMTVEPSSTISPTLLYTLAAIAVLAIGTVAFLMIRRAKKRNEEEEEEMIASTPLKDFDFEDESEEAQKRKRIENLAKNRPEDFAKLLRTWLAED